MQFRKQNNSFIIKLDKEEQLMKTLIPFCEEQKITAAHFTMIGAARDLELAYYDLKNQKYITKIFPNAYEVLSIIGNVSQKQEDHTTIIHAHGVFSDLQMQTIGGHVIEITINAAAEIFMQTFDQPLIKKPDPVTGLHLLDI